MSNNNSNASTIIPPQFQWAVLITVIVGTFLGRLDQTIVNLALPKMVNDFSVTITEGGWIATAYILANAIFVPIWGKLGDTIGRKKVYIWGFSMFIVGSVLAGLAWNLPSMILFRVIQAVAGSADYPTAMAILAVTFTEPKQKAQALGIWSSSFAAASVFGPLIGGPLIDAFGWRSVFLVNLPVGIIGLVMALIYINESVSEKKSMVFDWWGALSLGVTLSSVVLVLDKGTDWGWLSFESGLCYVIGILSLVAFIMIEHRAKEPMVDLKFFKDKVFVSALANNFIVFMGLMGSVFLIPVFAQTFLGYDATQSGYLFIPMAVFFMVSAPIGGMLVGKIESRYVIAGSTFIAACGIFLFSLIDPRSNAYDIMIPLAIMAFGMGLGMAQRTQSIAAAVPVEEIGVASSVLALVRNISGAFGVALFGTILNATIKDKVINIAQSSYIEVERTVTTVKELTGLIILKAQIASYAQVFEYASLLMFVGSVLAFFVKVDKKKEEASRHVEVHVE